MKSYLAIVIILLAATAMLLAREHRSSQSDRAAIERLHQLDAQTTLTDKADELAKLWDNNAVRIQPGSPVEIGKSKIYADDKRWEEKTGRSKTLCYKSEIQDVQIAGDWAFFGRQGLMLLLVRREQPSLSHCVPSTSLKEWAA